MSALVALALAVSPVLTLPELKARHAELTGRMVRVRGFLGPCAYLDCSLSSKPDPRVDQGNTRMSIGGDDDFDRHAAALIGREVIIEARFDDACLRGLVICPDRATTLQPRAGTPILPVESK